MAVYTFDNLETQQRFSCNLTLEEHNVNLSDGDSVNSVSPKIEGVYTKIVSNGSKCLESHLAISGSSVSVCNERDTREVRV